MWVENYRPTNHNRVIGNEETRLNFITWLKNWNNKSKPSLILGPPGIGKTTLVYTVARNFGYEVLELNASDVRTKTKLEKRLGPSRINSTLFEEKILIFLDEVDGVYGRQDRGGLEFLLDLIKGSRNPIVMVANVEDHKKMIKLIKRAQVFRFRRIPPKLLEMAVKNILKKEGRILNQVKLEMIVRDANGDIRAAVNSAQVASSGSEDLISEMRDIQISPIESLKLFFDSSTSEEAYLALNSCKMQPRDKIRAIFQSVHNAELDRIKLIEILDELSKVDEIVAKIGKTQNWTLLRYFDRMLANSLFVALKGTHVRYKEQTLPWKLQLRIWNDGVQLKKISSSVAKQHHLSSKDAALIDLPYIVLLSKLKNYEKRIIDRLRLDESAVKVLRKETQKVSQEIRKD